MSEVQNETVENEAVQNEAVQNEAAEAETTQATEDTREKRVRLSDEEFFEINERIASGEGASIEKIAEVTGLKPGSVTQRRNMFNRTYRDHGLKLTPLPRGGGQKKNVDKTAERLLAMREKMAGNSEKETQESASE